MPDIRTRPRSPRPLTRSKRPFAQSAKGQPAARSTPAKQAEPPKAQTKPALQPTKSLVKRFNSMVRQHPKRLAMGAAAVVAALGLCAIPGMPAALALFLVVGAVGFGIFQLYVAYATTLPAPVPIEQANPTHKETPTPKTKIATQTAKTFISPQPETPRASHKKRVDSSSRASALAVNKKPQHVEPLKVKATSQPIQATPAVSNRLITESAVSRRCRAMSRLGEWGDTPEFIALGAVFGRITHVVHPTYTLTFDTANVRGPDVYLYYNGVNHYDGFQNGQVKKVAGDGNCLFRSFGMQVDVDHAIARDLAVAWLKSNEKTTRESGMTIEEECEQANLDLRDY
jgi:hypothetical protein